MDGNCTVDLDNIDLFKTSLWGYSFPIDFSSILYQHSRSGTALPPLDNHEMLFVNKGW